MPAGFLYLLPLHGEDWLKVGISNDPLRRAREFSRRFHDLFDFDRALLVETETMRDAAAIELDFRRRFADWRAPMPLTLREQAGGHTEWYRGALAPMRAAAEALGEAGYRLHLPAFAWYAAAMARRRPDLGPWARALLADCLHDPDEPLAQPLPPEARQLLEDNVMAFRQFGLEVGDQLPRALQAWYATLPPLPPLPGENGDPGG